MGEHCAPFKFNWLRCLGAIEFDLQIGEEKRKNIVEEMPRDRNQRRERETRSLTHLIIIPK